MPVKVHSGWRLQTVDMRTQRLMGFHARNGWTLKVSAQRWCQWSVVGDHITTVTTLKGALLLECGAAPLILTTGDTHQF